MHLGCLCLYLLLESPYALGLPVPISVYSIHKWGYFVYGTCLESVESWHVAASDGLK